MLINVNIISTEIKLIVYLCFIASNEDNFKKIYSNGQKYAWLSFKLIVVTVLKKVFSRLNNADHFPNDPFQDKVSDFCWSSASI